MQMQDPKARPNGACAQLFPKYYRNIDQNLKCASRLFPGLPEVVHCHRPQLGRKIYFFSKPGHPGPVQLLRLLVRDADHCLAAYLLGGTRRNNQSIEFRPRNQQEINAFCQSDNSVSQTTLHETRRQPKRTLAAAAADVRHDKTRRGTNRTATRHGTPNETFQGLSDTRRTLHPRT